MKSAIHSNLKLDKESSSIGWLILLTGLITTGLVTYYVIKKNNYEDRLRFEYETSQIIRRIQNRMEQYEGALIQTRAFLLNSPSVKRKQLQEYFNDTQIFKRYPGLQGLGYSLLISADNLDAHVRELKKEVPHYHVWPMTPRETYSSIIVLEPSDWRNIKAIGFDMYHEPVRREAMDRASELNIVVMTPKIILVQEIHGEMKPGFIVYLPHYIKGADLSSVEKRRKSLIGFIYSPFRSRELFDVIATESGVNIDLEIYDGKPAKENLIYDYDKHSSLDKKLPGLNSTQTVPLLDRKFTMRFMPLPYFKISSSPYKGLAVFVSGSLLTFLLFGLYMITRKQMKVAKIFANDKAILLEREKEHVVARDDFLSIASHELKTPLTSLKLQAQVMKRAIDRQDPTIFSPEKVKQLINQIDNQTTRLARLVDDMLDISRIRTGRLKIEKDIVDLNEVVHDVVERLRHQFISAIGDVPVVIEAAGLKVNCDRFRMEQALTNLLTNAIRYGNKNPITIKLLHENKMAKIFVIDQGIGIAQENIDRIFEQFERAGMSSSEISGLGLGLFITNQIVKAHGGSIEVKSEVGHGSTFIINLPT